MPARDSKLSKLNQLVVQIRKIHENSRKTYGSPRIAAVLNAYERVASPKLVAKLMRENNIHAISHKKFRKKSKPGEGFIEHNLIKEKKVTAPNQVWVSDITYIWTHNKWMYLSSIMDLYSRKIIAHIMNDRMDSRLVEETLKLAASRRSFTSDTIFHSDKGSQYRSNSFKTLLKQYGFKQSMCGKANCYDNAAMESFHSSLKKEPIYSGTIDDKKTTQLKVFDYIEGFYNKSRIHSSL